MKTKFYQILLCSFIIASLLFAGKGYGQGYIAAARNFPGYQYSSTFIVNNGESYILSNYDGSSIGYPITIGTFNGGTEMLLTKLNANGNVIWSRFLGGSLNESASTIKYYNGYLYILGYSRSIDYPVTNGSSASYINFFGYANLVYTKINATTAAIEFSTYLNDPIHYGSYFVEASINDGVIYIHGSLTKFNNTGTSVISYSYSIRKYDDVSNLQIGSQYILDSCVNTKIEVVGNNIYLAGQTDRHSFPVTNGSVFNGNDLNIFYAKLNTSNYAIDFATYLGGQSTYLRSLKAHNDKIYLSGFAFKSSIPITGNSSASAIYQGVFITCFNSLNDSIVFSKLVGSSIYDTIPPSSSSITGVLNGMGSMAPIDIENNQIYLFATATGRGFPVTTGSSITAGQDLFFAKVNANNGDIQYSTLFLGTNYNEYAYGMKLFNGDAYLLASTEIINNQLLSAPSIFPTTNGSQPPPLYFNQAADILLKINTENKICFSTYINNPHSTTSRSKMDIDNQNIYMTADNNYSYNKVTDSLNSFINNNIYYGLLWTKFNLNPTMAQGIDSLLPATQPACKNGYANEITGQELFFPSNLMPTLYTNGVPSTQNPIPLKYQWQKSNTTTGPWVNIPGATEINYSPPQLGLVNQYYRRQAFASVCSSPSAISTSSVAAVIINAFTAPVITPTNILNNCVGKVIQVGGIPVATGVGGAIITSYLWGPSSVIFTPNAMIANPTVTPISNTIYSLQVMDNNGCKQIGYQLVNAYGANAGVDVVNCAGNIVRIGTAPVAGLQGAAYNWTAIPADITMSCTNCARPDVHPTVPTNYILTLTIPLAGNSSCITKDTVLVTPVNISPNFAGPDKTVCIGNVAYLGTVPVAEFNYSWTPTNYLNSPNSANPVFYSGLSSLPNQNPKIYHATASNAGCIFKDTMQVYLIGASAGTDGCGPRVIGMPDATPLIPKTFLWSIVSGVGNIIGSNNTAQINVGASINGTVIYRLATNANGVTCTDDVAVPVCDTIPPPGGGCEIPQIAVLAPYQCASYNANGGNVKLVASRSIPSTFTWSPAAGLSTTVGDTVSLTDNVPRTYTVTATNTTAPFESCSDSVSVNTAAIVPIFVAQDVLACPNAQVTIGQANVPDYSYFWEDPTGNSLSSDTISNPIATVSETTYFPVSVYSSSGCVVRDTASVTVIGFPLDMAGIDIALCDTNVAQLGLDPLPGYTYSWTGTANFIPNNTVANPKVIVNTTTTYFLIATNTSTGCSVMDSIIVTPPIPSFSFANISYCPSAGAVSLPTGPTGSYYYSWYPTNLVINPSNNGPTATTLVTPPSIPTTFTLYVFSAGCTRSASVLLTPNVINPVAGNNRTICKGLTTQLGGAAFPGTYSWSQSPSTGGSLNSSVISNPIFTANETGTYTFTVSKSIGVCASYASVVVTVVDANLPALQSPTVCQNTCIQIGVPSAGGQYSWNPTTGLSDATISNPIACVTTNSLAYTLTAVGVNGCIASQNMFVTVNPSPSHTVSVAPISACVGATGLSLNTVVYPTGSYNYLWSSNIGLSNIYAPNPTVSLTTVGTKNYNVLVTNNATGCATTASTTVTANGCVLPIKLESFTAAPQDKTVLLNWVVSEEINVLKYEIEFSTDGRSFWPIGSRAATNSTNYSLVHNNPVFGINYYRLKTIDNDGKISYSEIRTVNFKLSGSLTIYPNPAKDILHITFAAGSINKSATISVITTDGKIMYQKNIAKLSQTETLDVSKLANGCYIIRVLTNAELINKSVVVYR
jgi:hypothetical protein